MSSLISAFTQRRSEWLQALFEHLQISLLSLVIAIFIALPLAIIIVKRKRLAEITLQISGILQTLPSLALLGLFIPVFGIGRTPAIIALVVYAIFPILQNTITGLREIDPNLEEAARAFGMTRIEKLRKFQIPLSMPMIMGGIRTSLVMIIGAATLAALVGAGGLGSFILLGIDRNDSYLILIGAISSAALAVLLNFLIKFLENKKLKTILVSFLITVLILIISLINFNHSSKNKLVIAGKLGAEPSILINMYKDLIEENTDIKVELKDNFGKTTFLYEALKSGSIDIYPEFTGTIAWSLLKNLPKNLSNDPEEVYEFSKDEILKQDDLVFLKPMAYQNTYAIAVPRKIAKEYKLKKISDLKKVESKLKAGFSLEFKDRDDGNKGLISKYALNLNVSTMEPSLRYKAIANGDIQITEVFSTDSQIKVNDLVILEDDKKLFPPYQGAPLLRAETLEKYPELEEILNKLAGKITEEEMMQMNYQVDIDKKDPSQVARDYLLEKSLIEK